MSTPKKQSYSALLFASSPVHDFLVAKTKYPDFALLCTAFESQDVLHINTPITRQGYRELEPVMELLSSLQRRGKLVTWHLRFPWRDDLDSLELSVKAKGALLPRLSLAMPRVLRAAKSALDAGLNVTITGAPFCVLGPFVRFAELRESSGTFPSACNTCRFAPRISDPIACDGLCPDYAKHFGGQELRAISLTRGETTTPRDGA